MTIRATTDEIQLAKLSTILDGYCEQAERVGIRRGRTLRFGLSPFSAGVSAVQTISERPLIGASNGLLTNQYWRAAQPHSNCLGSEGCAGHRGPGTGEQQPATRTGGLAGRL